MYDYFFLLPQPHPHPDFFVLLAEDELFELEDLVVAILINSLTCIVTQSHQIL
jgi:hypothetical protein